MRGTGPGVARNERWRIVALGLAPLPAKYGLALAAILVGYIVLTQLMKSWLLRRFGLS